MSKRAQFTRLRKKCVLERSTTAYDVLKQANHKLHASVVTACLAENTCRRTNIGATYHIRSVVNILANEECRLTTANYQVGDV